MYSEDKTDNKVLFEELIARVSNTPTSPNYNITLIFFFCKIKDEKLII